MQYNTFKKSGTPRPLSFLKRSNGDSGDKVIMPQTNFVLQVSINREVRAKVNMMEFLLRLTKMMEFLFRLTKMMELIRRTSMMMIMWVIMIIQLMIA